MNDYLTRKPKKRWLKTLAILSLLVLIVFIAGVITLRQTYYKNLEPVSGSELSQLVTIPVGSSPAEVSVILEDAGLIKESWAFEWYVRNSGNQQKLLAGTYSLSPSQTVQQIVEIITGGKIATDLVTILPSRTLKQIRDDLINQGFDVHEVDEALKPSNYQNHPALVDKPVEASLEGYLFPESFQRTANTKAHDIVLSSLDQMQLFLTPEIRANFVNRGLTVHEGITMASIIQKEISDANEAQDIQDKKQVAQVFYKRLELDMLLQTDPTVAYASDKHPGELTADDYQNPSPYNTYHAKGLPPGPISNVGKNSLIAAANPADTGFLYFVTGNDCQTRFSSSLDEHENLKSRHGIGCRNS